MIDPVEETFPFQGQAVLHDLEAGIRLRIGDAASWGRAYRDRIARHRGALDELARRRGWTLTIDPASQALTIRAYQLSLNPEAACVQAATDCTTCGQDSFT